ncbi:MULTISPECIES: 3-isopropylmalate dehydratase small subunit [Paraburkholderia]|uniref:3-isopropylmalate dehydratase small subunit n=1 Tax=Paraburkholderia TaxID=1822464 RepID=UPI002255D4EB|nr:MULTISPECIES: 3-isopropylmalate dehydratase small subunit [Paraburkholderia]MCX4163281.1 3-isopropylmalate dehydratase small subunit [Paraburkholderia megapolitana]MDN7158777.1 3-isopropylmalate dehydratase small subunit [Paraburkholderia sp. CHISQ3]MDQ6495824.1 3-isopropylmalate dehydratase small subunit [Paraburkholderia megapolitana]
MNKVDIVTGAAAPLLRANLDTDTVIRIERLTQQPRHALGQYAFEALRRRADGSEDPDFVLNRQAYRAAPILLTGANFGCGSSREGAVWALFEAGIRCVIAESFGEIFYGNCFQNGMLPVRLDAHRIAELAALSEAGEPVTVSLVDCTISAGSVRFSFEIDALRRDALMAGLDEITQTFAYRAQIAEWQTADRERRPWIWVPLERQPAQSGS